MGLKNFTTRNVSLSSINKCITIYEKLNFYRMAMKLISQFADVEPAFT